MVDKVALGQVPLSINLSTASHPSSIIGADIIGRSAKSHKTPRTAYLPTLNIDHVNSKRVARRPPNATNSYGIYCLAIMAMTYMS
jgi:hypothetical protein